MKGILIALGLVVLVNLLAVAGGVAWLGGSGRISSERVRRVAAMFSEPTSVDEALAVERATRDAADEAEAAEAAHRLAVEGGYQSIDKRLAEMAGADDAARLVQERNARAAEALRQQVEMARKAVAVERAALAAERERFREAMSREVELRKGEDFQQAVAMVEALKGKQAKEMFESMLAAGKREEVVDYLAAMQLRKAAAVLKEFTAPGEAAVAAALLESVRLRNADPLGSPAAPDPAAGKGLFGPAADAAPPLPIEHADDRSASARRPDSRPSP